jgi:pimeloyl-ACP methyl ester carboxylesterase
MFGKTHGTAVRTKQLLFAAALAAATALVTRRRALKAETEHPPTGRFIDVAGVRLHFLERGRGTPVVLLHGNGALAQDFRGSGVFDRLAAHYRVVAFDRPGYGFSKRPRDRTWTPEAQAELLTSAFERLGIEHPVVVGHSWGTLVALALGLEHPDRVRGLLLLSGYYYPSLRPDVFLFAPAAIPVLGDAMRYTVSPLVGKLLVPGLLREMFAPLPVPDRFRTAVPQSLMLRPSQLRASAAESALMIPAAARLRKRYAGLRVPLNLIAGADDRIAHVERHSARLQKEVPGSNLQVLPGLGHMLHYFAQDAVVEAVNALAPPVAAIGDLPA